MSLTPSRPSSFQLASDDVHSWCASLDVSPETSARLYATLTPDERTRSARFRFERDRQRFIVARGVLRDLLGRYLQTQPGHLRFAYNAFGKPDLSPEFGNRLNFNLSHSAGRALIAIATASNAGVDLEYIRAQSEYADIARRFFSTAEVDYLSALPSHLYAEAFFSCWTKKEAYLWILLSIFMSPQRIRFQPRAGRSIPSDLLRAMPGHWPLTELAGAYVNGSGRCLNVSSEQVRRIMSL